MSEAFTSLQVCFLVGVFTLQLRSSRELLIRASQKLANREPTGRVFSQFHPKFQREQFHCAEVIVPATFHWHGS